MIIHYTPWLRWQYRLSWVIYLASSVYVVWYALTEAPLGWPVATMVAASTSLIISALMRIVFRLSHLQSIHQQGIDPRTVKFK